MDQRLGPSFSPTQISSRTCIELNAFMISSIIHSFQTGQSLHTESGIVAGIKRSHVHNTTFLPVPDEIWIR